jgi:HTH-type transcriptional regulator / antitoxin HigA
MREAMLSEIGELEGQLRHYEELRDGKVSGCELESLRDLPVALIEARIAAGIIQGGLAVRLGVAQQQVQRWEAGRYRRVSVDRLQDVADALGARIQERVQYVSALDRQSEAG